MSTPWRTEKVRRPRAQVQVFIDLLSAEIERLNPGIEYYFGGSWRRGAKVIGDIDFVVVTPNGKFNPDLLHQFEPLTLPDIIRVDRGKDKIIQGDLTLDVPKLNEDGVTLSAFFSEEITMHIDVWCCAPNERGAFLFFVTGPQELNISMRSKAIRMGMSLSQIGLLDGKTKQQLDDGTEESVAALLEMKYLTPEQRQAFATPVAGESGTQVHKVESSKPGKFYTVTVTGSQAFCSCPGYKYRKTCKHSQVYVPAL